MYIVSLRIGSARRCPHPCQKCCRAFRVEVEHFGSRKLPVAKSVQSQNVTFVPLSARAKPPLPPLYDDLVIARRNDPWIHPSLDRCRLQRIPQFVPGDRAGVYPVRRQVAFALRFNFWHFAQLHGKSGSLGFTIWPHLPQM